MTDQQTPPLAESRAEYAAEEPIRLTRAPSGELSAIENLNALAGSYEVSLERKDEAFGRTLRRETEWREKAESQALDHDRLAAEVGRLMGRVKELESENAAILKAMKNVNWEITDGPSGKFLKVRGTVHKIGEARLPPPEAR